MANHIGNKITVGAPHSLARFENADRICVECLRSELGRSVHYAALSLGSGAFATLTGQCYVCERETLVAVVQAIDRVTS